MLQDQDVKAKFPPLAVDLTRPRTMRCLVAMAYMLALVLLGLTIPDHSHAAEPASRQAAVTAGHDGDCPGPTHTLAPGHCCAAVHGHACCMLLKIIGTVAAVVTQARSQPRKPFFAEVVTAPVPRPPAYLAA